MACRFESTNESWPVNFNLQMRVMARKFGLCLSLPVPLQDLKPEPCTPPSRPPLQDLKLAAGVDVDWPLASRDPKPVRGQRAEGQRSRCLGCTGGRGAGGRGEGAEGQRGRWAEGRPKTLNPGWRHIH